MDKKGFLLFLNSETSSYAVLLHPVNVIMHICKTFACKHYALKILYNTCDETTFQVTFLQSDTVNAFKATQLSAVDYQYLINDNNYGGT